MTAVFNYLVRAPANKSTVIRIIRKILRSRNPWSERLYGVYAIEDDGPAYSATIESTVRDAECLKDAIHEALLARLNPEMESAVEVEYVGL